MQECKGINNLKNVENEEFHKKENALSGAAARTGSCKEKEIIQYIENIPIKAP